MKQLAIGFTMIPLVLVFGVLGSMALAGKPTNQLSSLEVTNWSPGAPYCKAYVDVDVDARGPYVIQFVATNGSGTFPTLEVSFNASQETTVSGYVYIPSGVAASSIHALLFKGKSVAVGDSVSETTLNGTWSCP